MLRDRQTVIGSLSLIDPLSHYPSHVIIGFREEDIQGRLLNKTTTPYFPAHRSNVPEKWIRAWGGLKLTVPYVIDKRILSGLRPDVIVAQGLCEVCAITPGSVEDVISELRPSPKILTLHPHSIEDVLVDVL